MNVPVLQLEGIVKRFPGVVALDGVSFAVGGGEIVALIGENGAGKSTLMKIVGGVYAPDAGQIFIDGKQTNFNGVGDSIRSGIGFIHQELNVLDNLDVAANVYLGREPLVQNNAGRAFRLIDRAEMNRRTQSFLDRLGLKFSPITPLSSLSLAEQQMVEIAKALSLNARLVIMDEPTSSLTLSETERLLQVSRELRADGVSIVYISHRLGEVGAIADRVVALRDGRNAGELARSDITHDKMVGLMVGRDLERLHIERAASAEPYFFRVQGLRTRRYPEKVVSISIGSGEILGMAGLVGAGRSEVAQAIFGVEPPLAGTMWLDGDGPFTIGSAQEAIARGIYLAPEDRRKSGLILEWPIRSNISLPALKQDAVGGCLVNQQREVEVAEQQKISLSIKAPSIETTAANLSGGNQQKVVLAKWLSLHPKVMIFDEPTRGIDVGVKAEIYKLMRALADNGVAVLMISSDMEEVLNVSDRIAVMCEGEITGFLHHEQADEEAVMQLAVVNRERGRGSSVL